MHSAYWAVYIGTEFYGLRRTLAEAVSLATLLEAEAPWANATIERHQP